MDGNERDGLKSVTERKTERCKFKTQLENERREACCGYIHEFRTGIRTEDDQEGRKMVARKEARA